MNPFHRRRPKPWPCRRHVGRFGTTLLLCLVAFPLAAAPLDLSAVPADAVWMMHLDMDAVRESTVVKRVYERAMKMHPHAATMIELAVKMTGSDPRKDLDGVTLYGFDTDKRNGVMVLRGSVNRDVLTRMVEKAADHRTMEHGGRTLHAWTHKRGGRSEPVAGAFFSDDVVVVSRLESHVKTAIDVLDGKKTSVGEDSPLAGRVRPGSILVARASDVAPETKCPVLRQGRSFRVAIGEHDGRSFYRARLRMESDTAAGHVESVVKGISSLVALRWGDDAVAVALASATRTTVEGDTCEIAWDASADDVWQVVSKAADAWEKRMKDRWSGKKADCKACGKDGCEGCQNQGDSSKLEKPAEKPLRNDEF